MTAAAGRRRRWPRRAALGAAVAVGALAAAVTVSYGRLERFELRPPPDQPGTTFLLVGHDARADLVAGDSRFGTVDDMPGARADVALILHVPASGQARLAVLPRDLLVFDARLIPRRLAVTHLDGPQGTVDALCRSLGIAVDHVATIGFRGFEDLVAAAGGVDVTVPAPTRDPISGLDLPSAGRQTLAAHQALALVRARHRETLGPNGWVPDDAGAAARLSSTGEVVAGLTERLGPAHPLRTARAAWAAAGAVSVDAGASLSDLVLLARSVRTAQHLDVPARVTEAAIPTAELLPGGADALAALGAEPSAERNRCRPQLLTAARNRA